MTGGQKGRGAPEKPPEERLSENFIIRVKRSVKDAYGALADSEKKAITKRLRQTLERELAKIKPES